MTDTTYNGWTNYETWLVNIHTDWIADDIEGMHLTTVYDLIDLYQQSLLETIESLNNERNAFAADLLSAAMERVDWYEIVDPVWTEHLEHKERTE